jgi:endo-1,4-beta-xylanase
LRQANRMKDLFSIFWSNPSVLGVTHWGYRQGNMWQTNAYLVKTDGTARPALTFIECYRAGGTNCPVDPYVPQPRKGDASGITLEAEEYDAAHALLPAGTVVGYASDGSWVGFDRVTFDGNWNAVSISYAKPGNVAVNLSVHLDSVDSAPVAILPLESTADWGTYKTLSIPWAPISGERNVFVRFNGGGANLDYVKFTAPTGLGPNVLGNSDFEATDSTGDWANLPWNADGAVARNTTRAYSGTASLAQTSRKAGAALYQNLSGRLVPGTTYKVSLWTTIGGAASANVNVTRNISCNDGSTPPGTGMGWFINPKTIVDGTWVELTGELVMPSCQLGWVAIWVEGPGEGVDLYLDHVSIRPVVVSGPPNLITDGTFESNQGAWGGWGYTALGVDNTAAHSGSQSLKGTGMQQYGAIARDIMALVSPGKRYQATAWVSATNTSGSGTVKWQWVQRCNGATSDSYPGMAFPTVANGSWVQVSGVVDLSACTTIEKMQLFAGADAGDLYLDDVSLTAL